MHFLKTFITMLCGSQVSRLPFVLLLSACSQPVSQPSLKPPTPKRLLELSFTWRLLKMKMKTVLLPPYACDTVTVASSRSRWL